MSAESLDALDARIDAHRRVLRWMLSRLITNPAHMDDLIATLEQPRIPQDHQEDPGAVPTEAFGLVAAFNAEMRAVLDPVKQHWGRSGTDGADRM